MVVAAATVLHGFIQPGAVGAENQTGIPTGTQTGAGSRYLMILAKAVKGTNAKTYYENTIKDIILADCARCHSGATRNLTDYDSLKMYADSGLLATMVQGPMRRFAGNDVQIILKWIQEGAPEKASVVPARFGPPPVSGNPIPGGHVTYQNTIKNILAKDCLRCHSGHFRNLTTYENVKIYVDNGLLKSLVLPGGPMHRFAGRDTHQIISWINSGAQP